MRRLLLPAVLVLSVLVPGSLAGASSATAGRTHPMPTVPSTVTFGAYVPGMESDPEALTRFESTVGTSVGIASYYYGYGDVFPGPTELALADGGRRDVLVAWNMGQAPFRSWAAGDQDAYLDQIAAAARSYPYPLYVRPWPEMNGDWQDFQPTPDGGLPAGGTYAEFRAAWQHVVGYLREHGATNLRWVFNPTADTYAGTTPIDEIWPGREYVDVLGLDGFNWGNGGFFHWQSFSDIFLTQYRNLTALDPTAPVWICETGSKEPAVDDGAPVDRRHKKAQWVSDMFRFTGMPRLTALVWFNARKERDWRVNSSSASLQAFRKALTG